MELELRDYIQIINKRKWMIVAIVLVCSMAAGLYSYFMINPTYEASTKIVVNNTSIDKTGTDPGLGDIERDLRMINTYKEIIKTPAIMKEVAEQHPDFNMNADELMNKVMVNSVNNTQVMTLIVKDQSYEKAAKIVNAVSLEFKEQIPTIFNVQNVTVLNLAEYNPEKVYAPVGPNIKLNIAIALIVGLMAAVGVAFMLEYMDDTIKTEADVLRYLDLPTIGQIAKMDHTELEQKTAKNARNIKAGEASHVQIGK
ncbi:YveK family protein [Paenibacillus montanisoli]|nr:Wzz/FepE/Etk N-terminal domain-containing protein [Paenibacillus montanisoli]